MNNDLKVQLQELTRRVSELESANLYQPARTAENPNIQFLADSCSELFDANGKGTLTASQLIARNGLPRPLWLGTSVSVWLDYADPLILFDNAAVILAAEYGTGTKTDIDNYTGLRAAAGGHFDATDVDSSNFEILDPNSLLDSVSSTDTVFFEAGPGSTLPNSLTVIDPELGGGGSEGPAGPQGPQGDPGADGEDGTIANMLQVAVNEASHVTAGTAFDFDNGVQLLGDTNPGTGNAANPINIPLLDNQTAVILQEESGTWQLLFGAQNIITAQVDSTGGVDTGDATFNFDNGSAIRGQAVTSGTADNDPRSSYYNNEELILFQKNNGSWQPLYRSNATNLAVIKGQATAAVAGTDASYSIDNLQAVIGRLPRNAAGTTLTSVTVINSPALKAANNDNIFAIYDETAGSDESDRWRTSGLNFDAIAKGYTGYDVAEVQAFIHDTGDIEWAEIKFLEVTITTS